MPVVVSVTADVGSLDDVAAGYPSGDPVDGYLR